MKKLFYLLYMRSVSFKCVEKLEWRKAVEEGTIMYQNSNVDPAESLIKTV